MTEAPAWLREPEVRWCSSLDGVSAVAWDALAEADDLYACYAWLRHLEYAAGPVPVLTCWMDGELLGALPVWEGERDTPGLFHLPDFFPGLAGPWQRRFRWLGTRRSVHNTVVCTSGAHRATAMTQLLDAVVADAEAGGKAGVIMPYMPVAAATELAADRPDARVVLHAAEAVIEIPADGIDGIHRRIGRHNRKRRRQELRAFAQAGHTVEWVDITASVVEDAAVLIANNRRRYGSDQGSEWLHRVFEAQRRTGLLDHAVALLCRRSEHLSATVICYRHGGGLHVRYFGDDGTEDNRLGRVYFVVGCHSPMEYAFRVGLRRVHLSTSSLEAKVRRGATLEPLAAVLLLCNGDPPARSAVQRHNRRVADEYRRRFADHPSALSPAWLEARG
jgi:hypothetical protein